MTRPFSFSDRQHFVQCLAIVRNLSIACAMGERPDSELGKRCNMLVTSVDDVMGELVGDSAYFHVQDGANRA
ncbi:hypothetical protein G5V57_05765 [Nordella sp. HKS 07]|uniref:hypothetical protein n=1 Tax=Nordella sp. HKS 07 TaxID=2712222 RepID=UPI0013E168B6|nr:hypothetical protein [Nordella sp. HKS 07]QIG47279.1 hypothetical protein G5V57_05765 [Nordella sp. HKS 07]